LKKFIGLVVARDVTRGYNSFVEEFLVQKCKDTKVRINVQRHQSANWRFWSNGKTLLCESSK